MFPVDAVMATSLVTVARWGETERITVHVDEDGSVVERELTRAQIADFATETGNPGNEKRVVSALDIQTPNKRLASGVAFVDTPGVGGVFHEHTSVTTGFLPSADAIVFVSDFTKVLTASELEFLRTAVAATEIGEAGDGLIFVVTKADKVTPAEREKFLTNLTEALTVALGRPAEELTVVPVSTRHKLHSMTSGDEQLLVDSNYPALEAVLWPTVASRHARVLVSGALTDLDSALTALIDPVEAELAGLSAKTAEELARLRADVQRRSEHVDGLRRNRAEWRQRLRADLQQVAAKCRVGIDERFDAVWHRLNTIYLEEPRYLQNPDQLVGQLAADAALVAGTVAELAQRRSSEVQRRFAREHGLELALPELAALPAPAVPPLRPTGGLHQPERTGRRWETVIRSLEGGGAGTTVGAVVGAVLGTLLAPGPGTVVVAQIGAGIGGVVGGIFGAQRSFRTVTARHRHDDLVARRRSLTTELDPLLRSQVRDLKANLDELVALLAAAAMEELDSRLEQEQESVTDALARLAEAEQGTQERAEARRAELAAERDVLLRLRAATGGLAQQAKRLGGPAQDPSDPADHGSSGEQPG